VLVVSVRLIKIVTGKKNTTKVFHLQIKLTDLHAPKKDLIY